jgi:putative drug exporter of the RND superfamily
MRQSLDSVLPETGPAHQDRRRRPRAPAVERIAGWSARHRKTAVFGWLLMVAGVFAVSQLMGSRNLPSYDPGQAGQAERALHQADPNYGAVTETVLIQARAPGETFAGRGGMQQAAREVAASLSALPKDAGSIRSPLRPGDASLVSADGRSALVTFQVPHANGNTDRMVAADQQAVAAVQARYPGLRIAETGDGSVGRAIDQSLNFRQAEATSVPITLILLLLVFGALMAAGIPILLAVSAVMAALAFVTISSHWLPVGTATSEVVLIVGMAVGVDYSLFYLRREREERARGASFPEALRIAAGTSGRAILVSGVTVMIAMAGLFLTGIDEFTGVALGTIAVVAIAVAGSLTVLPALLSWLGRRADWGKIPFLGRSRAAGRPSKLWAALVRRVVRHPAIWGGTAAVALLALAVPALGMRLGEPAIDAPQSLAVVQTANAVQRAFPQTPSPAQVVVTGTDVTGLRMQAAVAALQGRAAAGGAIREPVTANTVGSGSARVLVVNVPLAGNGTDTASYDALQTLRTSILPATVGQVPGAHFAVTGDTAQNHDFTRQLHDSTPIVLGLVSLLAFVILLIAFRSLVIPLVSIVLNLLSVGAAYGLVTLIFQDGHLQGPLGFTSFGGIISWVPLFMFVFLFGISMDYHVFILSRIRELRDRGATTREAVTGGIASSAGVVTSAALIMVAVFSIFATLPLIDLKILGVGTAAAVLIDATIVRGILVPAALALLGERTWYLPRPLHRLPSRPNPSAYPAHPAFGRLPSPPLTPEAPPSGVSRP